MCAPCGGALSPPGGPRPGRPSHRRLPRGRPAGGGALPQRRQPAAAAAELGISKTTLWRRMKRVWHPRPIRG
ncbi:MAG: helix-turn-helix domain-containing protein [Flavonifractor plautii]